MLRPAVLLTLLSGCHLVFGVDPEGGPAVCGPYAAPEEVAFSELVENPHELSIDAAGQLAMVNADYQGTTGPLALRLEGGVWVFDETRNMGLETRGGARLQASGVGLFAWDQAGTLITEYTLVEVAMGFVWNPVVQTIDFDTFDIKIAGNAIELERNGAIQRLLVLTRISTEGDRKLEIRRKTADNEAWGITSALETFPAHSPAITPSLGLLTEDAERFVYAATVGDDPVSHLYASARNVDNTSYSPGERLQIVGVGDDVEVTEPWINGDCSELYFTMEGRIMYARQLDAPDRGQ
ncbi:MAG TPA: hypothetical protein VM513_30610 [Kofleriaceae bacterium]|nr:hypothetical protein [Kofleriaceae bacterium]